MPRAMQSDPNSKSASDKQPLGRKPSFKLAALIVGLMPFMMVEAGLRLFDIGSPSQHDDPLVGFSEVNPLFDLDKDGSVYRTSRPRGLFFGPQEFKADKPDNGYRVFCLGGSTVRGRPYETQTAFCRWLELELAARDSTRQYECVNCGGLSYASYRLKLILAEVLQYQPNLIVLATGHNEFLEDRTYESLKARSSFRRWFEDRASSLRMVTAVRSLVKSERTRLEPAEGKTQLGDEVRAKLNDESGYGSYHRDDDWRDGVITHFEVSVRAMVEMCQEAGVPIVLVNLAANLRDTPPYKSEHATGLSPGDQAIWQAEFDSGTALDSSEPEAALTHYMNAEDIDSKHALLCFRIARCLDRVGQRETAVEYYVRAKENDICPLRIFESMRTAVADIASDLDVPIVDSKLLFAEGETLPCAGYDWYTDHVHPTIDGHQRIGAAIAEAVRKNNFASGLSELSDDQRRILYRNHLNSLGIAYFGNGLDRVGWLEGWARRERLYEESLPIDARGNLYRGFRRYGFGEHQTAWEDFGLALMEDPRLCEPLLKYARRLFDQGSFDAADKLLNRFARIPGNDEYQDELAALQTQIARLALAN